MATTVNISGKGDMSYCFAIVNGTRYTSGKSGITLTSSEIQLGVFGDAQNPGAVTIDGTVVLQAGSNKTDVYTWTVPSSVIEINIELNDTGGNSFATVTTVGGSGPHNTKIGNVAREIEGMTVTIGGVGREIESGTVLADGIVREISFGPNVFSVKLTGTFNNYYAHVTINGTKYGTGTSETVLELEEGSEIYVVVNYDSVQYPSSITLNGTQVSRYKYTLTVTGNVVITSSVPGVNWPYGVIKITME